MTLIYKSFHFQKKKRLVIRSSRSQPFSEANQEHVILHALHWAPIEWSLHVLGTSLNELQLGS